MVLMRRGVRETRSGRNDGHLVDCDVMVGTSPVMEQLLTVTLERSGRT
jgi:hypothetical protein